MISDVLQNKWVRATALLGAIIAICVVLYLLSAVLIPLFFAFTVAYIFDPVIDKIETYKIRGRNISRVGSIVTLVGSITLLSLVLPLLILPGVISQANSMMKPPKPAATSRSAAEDEARINEEVFGRVAARKIEDWLNLDTFVRIVGWAGPEATPSSGDSGNSATNEPDAEPSDTAKEASKDEATDAPTPPAVQDVDSIAIIRHKIGEHVERNAELLLKSLFPEWKAAGMSALRMLSVLGDTLLNLFLFIGNFVLFAFVAIYLLKDYDHIVAYGDSLVPLRYRPKVRDVMGRIDRQLRSFLRGQFMVCCCLGTMYAIGLTISGAPFAILLAIFGALASFVPYLGLILTIGPAVVLTVLFHGGVDWHVLGVLVTFAVAQFLEGNFLTPKIVGSQVGLGPVWVILAIMIFSSTLGFIGLLLAVPIAAILKVLAEEGLDYYRTSSFFVGEDSPNSS